MDYLPGRVPQQQPSGEDKIVMTPAHTDVSLGRAAPSRMVNQLSILLCCLAMVCDGFNVTIISLAMPAVAADWHLKGTGSFGAAFSAGVLGIMVGSPLMGSLANRLGRKAVFVFSLLFFGIASLAICGISSVWQLLALRFVTGVGLGGALPLGIVISVDLTRPAWRARIIAVVSTGMTVGAAAAAFSAGWLLPNYGWRSLFVLGGVIPILVGLAALFILPARRTAPEQERYLVSQRPGVIAELFRGDLALATPMIWALYLIVGLVNYFILSWSPTLYASAGHQPATVAVALGLFSGVGAAGGLLIGWPIDRFGIRPIALLFLFGVPVVLLLAIPGLSNLGLMVGLALSGFIQIALQVGMNGVAATVYPAAARAKGVGWGLGSVRLGQIVGASGGGLLIGAGLSLQMLFWLLAALLGLGGAASLHLTRRFRQPTAAARQR